MSKRTERVVHSLRDGPALVAITGINALLVVIATYAVLRVYDVLFNNEPNPATVMWSARIAMFWRLGIGAYAALLAAPMIWMVGRVHFDRTVAFTLRFFSIVVVAIAIQGIFFP